MGSSAADAYRALKQSQKSSRGAPAYSRFVNRPLGRIFAAVAHSWGMTPNAVTAVSGLVTFSGIVLIAAVPPTPLSAILVAVLLVLGYALDSADGQVARLRGGGSPAGEWLDHMVDSLKMATIHVAVLICWFRFYDQPDAWLLVPVAFSVVSSVFFFGVILTDLLRRLAGQGQPASAAAAKPTSALYSLAVIPADYGLLAVVFVLLWWQQGFVVIYTALAAINALLLLASAVRWYRSIAATGVAR